MFRLFRKNKSSNAFTAALNRLLIFHEACILFMSDLSNNDKFNLAMDLYFLGAVDCCSQRHDLSDKEFAKLISSFFKQIGKDSNYINILINYFLKMGILPEAETCVIEGGEHYNKWLNGDSEIPFNSGTTIQKYYNNPNFPESVGHLY